MQSQAELISIITAGRPDVAPDTIAQWAKYLGQLKGCHLYSVASPEKDQAEWLQRRRVGIGGSDISSVLGENKWSSPRQVWMSKMGMFDDKPPTQSESARWGNLLETTVATEWGLRNNRQWVHIPVILQDDERSYLLANIDGFTLDDNRELITGILEIKTTSAYNNDEWEFGPIPNHYMHQTNWYCGITRLTQYTIVCLVGGQKLYWHELPAEPERYAKQVAAADIFWNEYVLKGIEPKASDVDKDLIAAELNENPPNEEPIVDTADDTENLAEAYCKLRDQISALTKVKNELQAQLMVKMGQASSMLTKTHTLQYSSKNTRSCNYTLLEKQYPAIYAEVVTSKASRTLNIN